MTNSGVAPEIFASLIDAMFSMDGRGHLTGDAPYLHVLRTARDVLVYVHETLPSDIARRVRVVATRERGRPAHWQRDYAEYLNVIAAGGFQVSAVRAGPLYVVPDKPETGARAIAITQENARCLAGGLGEWLPAVTGQPFFAVVENGRAVAVCATVRASALAHCAGVETIAPARGKGFASAAVAGWAQAVRDLGATPFYATTFDNVASQRVAMRLGMELVGSEFSVYCWPS